MSDVQERSALVGRSRDWEEQTRLSLIEVRLEGTPSSTTSMKCLFDTASVLTALSAIAAANKSQIYLEGHEWMQTILPFAPHNGFRS
jgi:hypothetical protein